MIIFLDMDGVLCTGRAQSAITRGFQPSPFAAIDSIGVGLINKWVRYLADAWQEETEIVFSSTWRIGQNFVGISQLLGAIGLYPTLHRDWTTRYTAMTLEGVIDKRGFQIRDWLLDHPEETRWMILDDDTDMMDEQLSRFIHTDAFNGITMQNHMDALKMIDQIMKAEI
jgi:hypothetical protein